MSCAIHHEQISAIYKLRDLFSNWIPSTTLSPPNPDPVPSPPLPVPVLHVHSQPPMPPPKVVPLTRVVPIPRVNPHPRVYPFPNIVAYPTISLTQPVLPPPKFVTPDTSQPVSHRTRYRLYLTSHVVEHRKYPYYFINDWAFYVLDETTGQTLEHRQL